METIIVEPLAGGWTVRADGVENDLVFRSGANAEDAAKALAFRLAEAGEPVRLRVTLRNSDVTARFVCMPPLEPGERPRLIDLPATARAGTGPGVGAHSAG